MAYLFKQKLVFKPVPPARLVFVVEPEEYLLELYCKHLLAEQYEVRGFRDLDALVLPPGRGAGPDVAVISTQQLRRPDFQDIKTEKLPASVKIISVGSSTDADFIRNLMSMGVSSHLERRLTRPRDLVEIVGALFYH